MDAVVQSVEDNLLESLKFRLKPSASYVVDRRSVSYWPSGGDSYSPTGVKVIKIKMTGEQWADPSTVKMMFDITNTNAADNDITPVVAGGWGMFRRMRVLAGGSLLEDIDEYNRLHEMFHMFKPTDKRTNDSIEGFGSSVAIAQNKTRTIAFTPMSGLLSQEKYLPIRNCALEFEFELVSNATDAFTGTTVAWQINNVQMKADMITLDNTLDNEYTRYLLEGKPLPIHFTSYTHASQVIAQLNSSVNVQRSLTRLKSVFVSMSNDDTGKKEVNDFWHPMAVASGAYDYDKELNFELQIGSKKYPEYPIRSVAEAYSQLRKALGIHSNNAQMDIAATEYCSSKFVFAIDLEKVLQSSFSGFNSRAGDLLTLKLNKNNDAALAGTTTKLHYVLVYDVLMNIGFSGIDVLD